jgi:hypothetical protein
MLVIIRFIDCYLQCTMRDSIAESHKFENHYYKWHQTNGKCSRYLFKHKGQGNNGIINKAETQILQRIVYIHSNLSS